MRLTIVLLVALPLVTLSMFADGGACPTPWGYDKDNGPDRWGQMEVGFAKCDSGFIQSPINLGTATTGEARSLTINYAPSFPVAIQRTSHEIKVWPLAANTVTYEGTTYQLEQFHFHVKAEHTIGRLRHDAELHLVHKTTTTPQKAFVLAVFITAKESNEGLGPLLRAAPATTCTSAKLDEYAGLSKLLPEDRDHYYWYEGSLTTPECSEGIQFLVFAQPIEATAAEIERLKVLKLTGNARPVQPTGGRPVRKTAGTE